MVFKLKSDRVTGSCHFSSQVGRTVLGIALFGVMQAPVKAQLQAGSEASDNDRPVLQRLPKTTSRTVIQAPTAKRTISAEQVRIAISGFQVEGHPEISEQALSDLLLPLKGKELTLPEFEQHVHAVAQYLRDIGHPNATVSISKARLKEGVIAMLVQGLNPRAPESVEPTVLVQNFNVTGTSIASKEEFDALLEPWKDKPMTFEELNELPVQVAGLLRGKGYVLAQAWLPPQRIDDGVLEIAVVDGKIDGSMNNGGVVVNGADERIRPEVIKRYLSESVVPDEPLMVSELDSALRIVDELPGVASARSTLIPGSQPGTTQVQVDVEEEKLMTGSAWADNYGDIYTGRNRLNAQVDLNSPSGNGEKYSINVSRSEGMTMVKGTAQMPVGSRGDTLGISATNLRLDIDPTAVPANLSSDSTIFSVFANHPLQRSEAFNSSLVGTLDVKRHKNETENFELDDRKITMGSVGWYGNLLDSYGGAGAWNLNVSLANLDLSGEPGYQAIDEVTAQTEGSFAKFNWDLGRRAPLGDSDWYYYTGFKGQLASKNLDPAEKFQLGGPEGVRAYPVGEGLGDHGWLFSAELRRSLGVSRFGETQIFGFADVGGITQYHSPWSGALNPEQPNSYTLSGAGIGASISGKRASLSVSAAQKIDNNPNPGPGDTDVDGTDDSVRIWIIGNIVF